MSTVLEIERAIGQLPPAQLLEVGEWLDEQRAALAASAGGVPSPRRGGEGQQWED